MFRYIFAVLLLIVAVANATVDLEALYRAANITIPASQCASAASKAGHYASCGCPYVWGGTSCGCGGSGGMDCSGLVYTSYREAGYTGIQRTTFEQINQGSSCGSCSPSNLGSCKVGALFFYCFSQPCPDHVVMYLGGGKAAECPEPGQDCHIITPYSESYYACRTLC
ncbi:NLP/P60 domain-containing protein [Cavenderia fasciculata]|uniref:NLP/P60 domain-containing protein n=1 Tax=Cavenderia fasciculata TaxID=261658 RepID=F4PJ99_CACFS|nr:NLP/P60 domain-containing protein [Cavenderia fasciculata]EGG24385.1 NLP/P60 domain-containing protein [Cavenderia fasciculata]|eukprot:XP_004362236.1 NLP/P60 domain-containing protein [Cavenderia fasciculata]